MLTVSEAYQTVLASVHACGTESVDLRDATGRVLREPVYADRDYPPINRATMDGIALNASSWTSDVRRWRVERVVAAGSEPPPLVRTQDGCVRIMTGAALPDNCDGIIPFEDISLDDGYAEANETASFEPGRFVHAKSSDRKAGDTLLVPDTLLTPPRIAIMASVGMTKARVSVQPRVAVVSTGNEVVPVEQSVVSPAQVRASNLAGLVSALNARGIGHVTATHIADDLETTVERIRSLVESHDLLVLSGGVSKGDFDYVPEALAQAGVRKFFHRVAQRPGKPLWFGQNESCTVFGLPGNPVSSLTVFRRYVVPWLEARLGLTPETPRKVGLSRAIDPHENLTLLYPVRLDEGGDSASPVEYHGSGDFAALSTSDGFVEIPPGGGGDPNVDFWSW